MPTSVQVKASEANNSHGLDLAVARCALDGHSGRADSLQTERSKSEGHRQNHGVRHTATSQDGTSGQISVLLLRADHQN